PGRWPSQIAPKAVAPGTVAPAGAAATAFGAIWLGEDAAAEAAAAPRDRIEDLRRNRNRLRALLADPAFTGRAPEAVVRRERERLADIEERLRQVGGQMGPG
ncbi:MAG TPA: hypothetical protein VJ839_00700, partial [Candidatus Limnocylindria bacterium]|nr:hypothetical protein [Candidatus Limnocylindria bacterium]